MNKFFRKWIPRVFADKFFALSESQLKVCWCLMQWSDAFPSIEKIAHITGLSFRCVENAINGYTHKGGHRVVGLVELGILEAQTRYTNGEQTSNRYTWCEPKIDNKDNGFSDPPATCCTPLRPAKRRRPVAPYKQVNDKQVNFKEKRLEEKGAPTPTAQTDEFAKTKEKTENGNSSFSSSFSGKDSSGTLPSAAFVSKWNTFYKERFGTNAPANNEEAVNVVLSFIYDKKITQEQWFAWAKKYLTTYNKTSVSLSYLSHPVAIKNFTDNFIPTFDVPDLKRRLVLLLSNVKMSSEAKLVLSEYSMGVYPVNCRSKEEFLHRSVIGMEKRL